VRLSSLIPAVAGMLMVSAPFLWCRYKGIDPGKYGLAWKCPRRNLIECAAATASILLALTVVSMNWPGEELPRSVSLRRALDFASSGVAAAIIEEIFFRGWVQPMLRQATGAALSVLLTSAIFAASHIFVARTVFMLAVFVPGVVMGLLRERHGNIATSTLFHMCGNIWAVWFVPLHFPGLLELLGRLSF